LYPDANRHLATPESGAADVDLAVAQWAFDHGQPAGRGTDTLPGSRALYLPLKAPMRMRGVLVLEQEPGEPPADSGRIRHAEAAASLIAIALERVHFVEVAQDALVRMESERFRNTPLAALSHDVRTPLTALVGLADALARARDPLTTNQRELVLGLREEAERMNRLVHNLLDMARLSAGKVSLNLEWHSIEEAVGSALRAIASVLRDHKVVTDLPPDLPLARFDAVLLERVLCNLLENAAKYTPPRSEIRVAARPVAENLEVAVEDNGPGLPLGREDLFEKFTRGEEESAVPGLGLGLSICRAIVEAHGGKIRAERPARGGARFIFSLPLGTPPPPPPIELT
jgi:two-component system sensor histidine kinase KdpD